MRQRRTIIEKQTYGHPTFWQRLLLVSAILLSGAILAGMIPSQPAHASTNCLAGRGGPGGIANGGQGGYAGGLGGDCVIDGNKTFVPGGINQNNRNQGASQTNGGNNIP